MEMSTFILSCSDKDVTVEADFVKNCVTLRNLLEDCPDTAYLPVPNASSTIINFLANVWKSASKRISYEDEWKKLSLPEKSKRIDEWMITHRNDGGNEGPVIEKPDLLSDSTLLMQAILTADYLDCPPILNQLCDTFATKYLLKTSVEIRNEFNLKDDLTEKEKRELEDEKSRLLLA